MPPLVRSDVNVAYKLILKNGAVVDVGSYHRKISRIRSLQDRIKTFEIPHLQRLSPDQALLASLDAERNLLWLHETKRPGKFKVLRIRLSGLSGAIKTFRWLKNGSGIIVHTEKNLWHVPLQQEGQLHDMNSVEAKPLVEGTIARQIQDFRMLDKGFILRANLRLYIARLQPEFTLRDITPYKRFVQSATIGPDGRIYMAVATSTWLHEVHLWTLKAGEQEIPRLVGIQADLEDGAVLNWAASGDWLALSRTWNGLSIFQPFEGAMTREIKLKMDPDLPMDDVHTLWPGASGETLLSSTSKTLRVWSQEGTLLWNWPETTEHEDHIYGARFTPDGESVIASLKDRVVLLRDGRIVKTLITREEAEELGVKGKHSFLENAHLLSDGSLTVSVVRAKQSITWERRPRRPRKPRKTRTLRPNS